MDVQPFGYLPTLWRLARDPIGCFRWVDRRYGRTALFRRPGRRGKLLLVTSDPDWIREVVTDDGYRNSTLTLAGPSGSAQRRIRRSLFRLHGEEHRRERRLMLPALQKRTADAHRDTMAGIVDETLASWRVGERRDLEREMKDLTRRIAAATLFGESDLAASEAAGRSIERWIQLNYRNRTRILQLDIPGTPYAEMLALAQELEASLLEMIRRRRSESARGPDLLSAIVRAVDAEGGISERNLVGQSVVMFLAAHETTAYALVWTLFLLSQHPELAVRLSHELRNTLGGAPPKDNEVALLGHVIQESLRLFPVVPYTVRVAMRPARLPGLDVPRHTRILIPFDVAHRRAESFPRPQAFAPERWQSLEPPPYTYMPFGAGLHMCVGASFATRTLEIVLSMLLQRFQPVPAAGARIDRRVTVTIAPRRGLPMTLLEAGRPFERAPVRGDVHDMVDLSGGGE